METLVSFGSEMKVLGETSDAWQVGGWAVVFGTRDVTNLKDRFDGATDYDFEEGEKRTLYYNHGLDGTIKKTKMGQVKLETKDAGVWYSGELKKRTDYLQAHAERIAEGIKNGIFGTSTGAPAHLVEREKCPQGHNVKMWPIAEVSITPTPAEPLTSCVSLKSLAEIEAADENTPKFEEATAETDVVPDATDATKSLEILEAGQLYGSRFVDHSSRLLAAVGEYDERVEDLASKRAIKAGRVISEAHHAHISEICDALLAAAGKLKAHLGTHAPEPAGNDGMAGKSLAADDVELEIALMRQRIAAATLAVPIN